ncbi:hypothetical protein ACVWZX_004213 [Deinococcus sp. UYEF24]
MRWVSNLSIGCWWHWLLPVEHAFNLHSVPWAALAGPEAVGLELHCDGPQAQSLPSKCTSVGGHSAHIVHCAFQVGFRPRLLGFEI